MADRPGQRRPVVLDPILTSRGRDESTAASARSISPSKDNLTPTSASFLSQAEGGLLRMVSDHGGGASSNRRRQGSWQGLLAHEEAKALPRNSFDSAGPLSRRSGEVWRDDSRKSVEPGGDGGRASDRASFQSSHPPTRMGRGGEASVPIETSPLSSRPSSPVWRPSQAAGPWRRHRALAEGFRSTRTGRFRIPPWANAYTWLLAWCFTSAVFAVVMARWHAEVFGALDSFARWLRDEGFKGYLYIIVAIMGTTVPPIPGYSTLIVLSGYAFSNLWIAFACSYIAALGGACIVYYASKMFLRPYMAKSLASNPSFKRVVYAIERRPRLLFLIRLSPYPYNVMNALLASSDVLTFKTYFLCTALALPKLLIHVSIGTTIRDFTRPPGAPVDGATAEEREREEFGERMKLWAGVGGLVLALGMFVYLFFVARGAVNETQFDDDESPGPSTSHLRLRSHLSPTFNLPQTTGQVYKDGSEDVSHLKANISTREDARC